MTDKKNKKSGRHAYLNKFEKNNSDQYEYRGTIYTYDDKALSYGRWLARLWICGIVMAAAVLVNGCIPAPGMQNCIYVLLPYVLQLLAAVSVCWAIVRLTAGGAQLREYIYQATVEKLPMRTMLTAILAIAAAVGEVIFLIRNGAGDYLRAAICFLVLEAVTASAAVWLHWVVDAAQKEGFRHE
jgi:hypothetical protein